MSMPEDDLFRQAVSLLQGGEFDRSLLAFRRVLLREPGNVAARRGLAAALIKSGDVTGGAAELDRLTTETPDDPTPLLNKITWLTEIGALETAEAACRDLTRRFPDEPKAWMLQYDLLNRLNRFDDAISAAMRAYNCSGRAPIYGVHVARAMEQDGKAEEAARFLKPLLWEAPDHAEAWMVLGNAKAAMGEFDAAKRAYLEAADRAPHWGRPWNMLSQIHRFSADDAYGVELDKALAANAQTESKERGHLLFADARRHDHLGRADRAFALFEQAARLLADPQPAQIADEIWRVEAMAAQFPMPHPCIDNPSPAGVPIPIFILGMPRSGTTLLERILCGDNAVSSVAEREYLLECFRDLDFSALKTDLQTGTLSPPSIQALRRGAQRYRGYLTRHQTATRYVIDKSPYNFTLIGLIRLALPEAVILHCTRDPADTCVSIFQQSFEGRAFAFSLTGLGAFYRAYHRLMAHWRAQDGSEIIDVAYEQLVRAPETVLKPLVARLGLTYGDHLLDTQGRRGVIRTASVAQARAPINARSIGRWRTYAPHLGPLFNALGDLAPPQ